MKIKFYHPEASKEEITGPSYWKSLDELSHTPEFNEWVQKEFPSGASELEGVNRRHFLKIMGASFGLAGLALSGCRSPRHYILPYAKQPENIIPGVPLFYATSVPRGRDNIPVLVETHEARPTKIEGNPSYKPYGGSTNVQAQASVLDLYDPDRVQQSHAADGSALSNPKTVEFLAGIGSLYEASKGAGLAFLATESTSPTRQRLVEELQKRFPQAIWAEYDPLAFSNQEKALNQLTDKNLRARYHFAQAKRIFAIESNFLMTHPAALGNSRQFAEGRRVHSMDDAEKMNQLSDNSLSASLHFTKRNASKYIKSM